MVYCDYLNFELVSIRLRGQTYSEKTFDFILIYVFLIHLKRESISFQQCFFEVMCNLSTF
jgi:hypothetical protein